MAIPPGEGSPAASTWAVEHAAELSLLGPPAPQGQVEVVLLTDPWSVWCWGFEPVRRTLAHRYPTVPFRHLVGGMFPTMPDPEAIGFNVARFFGVVQRTTGMPLRLDATRNDRPKSTYPACIHVAAVRLLRPDLEALYLRRLREAVYLDGRNVSRPEVAQDVAESIGVPADEFRAALASGEPEREFRETLTRLHSQDLHGYPTFLVRSGHQIVRVEGYQCLPALLNVVEHVSGRAHLSVPAPPLVDLVPRGERVATREIAEVLDQSLEATVEALADLETQGLLVRERHANGDVWMRLAP